MSRSLCTTGSLAFLMTLTACGTLPANSKKNLAVSNQARNIFAPSMTEDFSDRMRADSLFIEADIYSREGKSARAIELFEKVVTLDPAPYVRLRLAAEYYKVNKNSAAIAHAEKAIKQNPQDVDAYILLGGLYSADKKDDLAIAQYNQALHLDPENAEATLSLGSLYTQLKAYKKAAKLFTSLLKNPEYKTPHLAHYNLGLMYAHQGGAKNQSAAIHEFKKALELRSWHTDSLTSLANIYLEQGNQELALEMYERLEENSDLSIESQMKMVLILIEQKRFNLAATKLKDIVTENPSADGARYYLAAVQEQTGELDEAIKNYMKVSAKSENFSQAVVHAAYLLKSMGKIKQALVITEKGLKANADKPQVYTMHASLLGAKADYLGAAKILEQGLTKHSQNSELLFQYALAMDRLGKKNEMMAQMKKVLELEPDHVQSMSYLAYSMAELNLQLPEAEKLARRAVELQPQDAYVLDTLGWVLFKQNKVASAIEVLEQAHQAQPNAKIIAEHLAQAYAKQDLAEKSAAMYKIAAELKQN
ncbi:tetratricopeptide repeat protein [Bdellovibrio bacteriovorus]|uniref:tetratricopeptide repeat protein n=1 Tax=Bdellovibrio bacteriovorus TaxID=959 RepID=UPI000A9FEFCF|nr:tetratricopeptide repeat protein [Bdellovibrio bacteriovorus]